MQTHVCKPVYVDALDIERNHRHRICFEDLEWMDNSDLQPIESPSEFAVEPEKVEAAVEELKYLLPRERELLRLRAEGMQQVDIAKRLGCKQSNVSHALQRILSKIQWHRVNGHAWNEREIYEALSGFATIEPYRGPPVTRRMAARVAFLWVTGASFIKAGAEYKLSFTQARHTVQRALKTFLESNSDLAKPLEALLSTASHRNQSGLDPWRLQCRKLTRSRGA